MKHFSMSIQVIILTILLFLFASGLCFAHRVVIFAWTEGDMVFTQSQFPDGKKISNAPVKVLDMQNNLLLEGKTDDNGEFSFKIPKMTGLTIVLEAGMGHQGEWRISEEEIKSALGETVETPAADTGPPGLPEAAVSEPVEPSPVPEDVLVVSKKQLERIVEQAVEKALDKKLHPLTRMLAKMQDTGPSISDIFGGIGYILGLMGVAAYFLSRKKN